MDDKIRPIMYRAEGVTRSERYLRRLCDKTVLSLWNYSGIYRDQGRNAKGHGKEVCDLLVVFENHIIIFSDKDCQFPNTGNLELDWCRWFRRGVLESANQVWGAERWIRTHPDRLFLDRACTQPFPLDLPSLDNACFHRIVVAHTASQRCQRELGGSGSLMLMPRITGSMHYEPKNGPVVPFAIGQIDPARGYVHVLDDTSLDVILGTLDTITDFVNYLMKKEQFITGGSLGAAAGEEDLLGYYLGKVNEQDEHDFVFREKADLVYLDQGFWEDFNRSPERRRQLQANEDSYTWDRIIEKFAHHITSGTSYSNSHPRIADQVVPLRYMARESRTRRRLLSQCLLGLLEKTPTKPTRGHTLRANRVVKPSRPGDPYYVFLLLSVPDDKPNEEYREVRRLLLEQLCLTAKLEFPDAQDIVGFATEPGLEGTKSEDAVYIDARDWSPDMQAEAEEIREELGLLKNLTMYQGRIMEYPDPPPALKQAKSLRNSSCPCGSGKKYKKCCGRWSR